MSVGRGLGEGEAACGSVHSSALLGVMRLLLQVSAQHAGTHSACWLVPLRLSQVPPLRYEWVWALKRDFPHLDFSLNGGVLTLEETAAALRIVNGEQPDAAASGDGEEGSAEAAATAAAEASGEGVAAAAAAAVGIPAGSSAGVDGRQGIWGVMVGRAAYNMPWDMLGAPLDAVALAAAAAAAALANCLTLPAAVILCPTEHAAGLSSCQLQPMPTAPSLARPPMQPPAGVRCVQGRG